MGKFLGWQTGRDQLLCSVEDWENPRGEGHLGHLGIAASTPLGKTRQLEASKKKGRPVG